MHHVWTGKFDGKDYAVTGNPADDTRVYKRVNEHTLTFDQKKAGKVVATGRVDVAADGKSRTVSTSGTREGQKITTTACTTGSRAQGTTIVAAEGRISFREIGDRRAGGALVVAGCPRRRVAMVIPPAARPRIQQLAAFIARIRAVDNHAHVNSVTPGGSVSSIRP